MAASTAPIIYLIGGALVLLVLLRTASAGEPQDVSAATRKLAEAIAYAEGYYIGDRQLNTGKLPVTLNNPGDITDGRGNLRQFGDASAGWAALYDLIESIWTGDSRFYQPTMTVLEFAMVYTGAHGVELTNWASVVAQRSGVTVTSQLQEIS